MAYPLTGLHGVAGCAEGRRVQRRRRRRSDQLRWGVHRHTEPPSFVVAGAPRGAGVCVGPGEAGGGAVVGVGAGALWAVSAGSLNATSGSAGVLLDVSQDNAMDDSDILDGVGVLARDVVANERAEGVAAFGAMVVDERFGALLDGSQGDAMDDSSGQGFGGAFAGGVSVEERVAGGGGRNHGPRLDADAGQGAGGGSAAPVLAEDGGGSVDSAAQKKIRNALSNKRQKDKKRDLFQYARK